MFDRLILVAIMPITLASGAFGWASGKNTPENDLAFLSVTPTEIAQEEAKTSKASALVVTRSHDGLFRLTVLINGSKIPMIIDTGATSSVISKRLATELGLQPLSTASGRLITMGGQRDFYKVAVKTINVGRLSQKNSTLIMLDSDTNVNLIGQDLLQKMGAMRMDKDKITFD